MIYFIKKLLRFKLLRFLLGFKLLRFIYIAIKKIIYRIPQIKIDLIDHYKFTDTNLFLENDIPITNKEFSNNNITWVIPDFNFGSGGHLNIFRFIYMLEKLGYENQTINIINHHYSKNKKQYLDKINKWFFPIKSNITFGEEELNSTKYMIATSWKTAYTVKRSQNVKHKLYFVQDYEPFFYPISSEYHFAKNTYDFEFTGITAGKWLKNKLSNNHNMKCYDLSFSYDKNLYKPLKTKKTIYKNIFFYARPPTPRRLFELGILALDKVCKKHNNVQVTFAGWDINMYKIKFPHTSSGILKINELPKLFSESDVGLVLSGTNLSLLPLEIMACKCPVVINEGENNEWLFNKSHAHFVANNVESIANGIEKVLFNDDYANKVKESAYDFAINTSWENEGEKLKKILEEIDS